jgi:hypothetical protein
LPRREWVAVYVQTPADDEPCKCHCRAMAAALAFAVDVDPFYGALLAAYGHWGHGRSPNGSRIASSSKRNERCASFVGNSHNRIVLFLFHNSAIRRGDRHFNCSATLSMPAWAQASSLSRPGAPLTPKAKQDTNFAVAANESVSFATRCPLPQDGAGCRNRQRHWDIRLGQPDPGGEEGDIIASHGRLAVARSSLGWRRSRDCSEWVIRVGFAGVAWSR